MLQDGGEPVKQCKDKRICFLFRTPTRYATYLKLAGFDVMSLANNHARDFGEEGRTLEHGGTRLRWAFTIPDARARSRA